MARGTARARSSIDDARADEVQFVECGDPGVKSVSPGWTGGPGDTLTYTLTVTNPALATAAATGVHLTDAIPATRTTGNRGVPVGVGGIVEYTLTIANSGNENAENVVVEGPVLNRLRVHRRLCFRQFRPGAWRGDVDPRHAAGEVHERGVAHADRCAGGRRRAARDDVRLGRQRWQLRGGWRLWARHGHLAGAKPGRWRQRDSYLQGGGRQSDESGEFDVFNSAAVQPTQVADAAESNRTQHLTPPLPPSQTPTPPQQRPRHRSRGNLDGGRARARP